MKKDETKINANYIVDPEYTIGFQRFLSKVPIDRPVYKEYWQQVRANNNLFYETNNRQFQPEGELETKDLEFITSDKVVIKMKWFSPKNTKSQSAVIYYHGGGRIAGNNKMFEPLVSWYVQQTGVPFLLVDYRLTPEVSAMRQIEDCFESLQWLTAQAGSLGIDQTRIAIMGDSGGGGIAAGVAILARQNDVRIAKQILIYPMLDDRRALSEKHIGAYQLLSNHDLNVCWETVLGHPIGKDGVSEIVSPGRLKDYEGLAPAFLSVGFFDNLRQECIAYAENLLKAGVPVEFHLYPGVPHGFDLVAPEAQSSKRAQADYFRVIREV